MKEARFAALHVVRQWCGRHGEKVALPLLDECDGADLETTAFAAVEMALVGEQMWRKLCEISTYQEIRVMYRWIWLGQTIAEIAKVMGRNPGRITQLQSNCLNRYRKEMGIPRPPRRHGAARGWH